MAAEPAVGRLGRGAGLGGLLGLLALGLRRDAAGVALRPGVDLDLGVGPQQGAGDLVGIDPDGQVDGIVDDVLPQLEGQVEYVVATGPSRRRPLPPARPIRAGRSSAAVPAPGCRR